MQDVRDCLREYISDNLLKQADVARRVGMSPITLCSILKKRRNLEANEFLGICSALGVSASEIGEYQGRSRTA